MCIVVLTLASEAKQPDSGVTTPLHRHQRRVTVHEASDATIEHLARFGSTKSGIKATAAPVPHNGPLTNTFLNIGVVSASRSSIAGTDIQPCLDK